MKEYLKINIDQLDDVKKRYLEIQDQLATIEKQLGRLITEFSSDNSSQTADKIVEIMETYEKVITDNIEIFEMLHDSVDEYLELVEERLEPNSYQDIIIDFEEVIAMKTELGLEFETPRADINGYIEAAQQLLEHNLGRLTRKVEDASNVDNIENTKDQLQATMHNLKKINGLQIDLSRLLHFDQELDEINRAINDLEIFITEETSIDLTHIEDHLNELEAFKLEVNLHALNALLPNEITSDIIDQVLDKLDITNKSQLVNKIKELKQAGMFDNFYANVRTQIELMGLDEFLEESERIKWLADNPQVRVGEFCSDLSPNQLRMLCEELPYVMFSKNPEGGLEFREEFYNYLTDATDGGYIIIDTMFGSKQIYTDRFLDNELNFEKIKRPGTDEPWYIDENGFQAVAMRVNGEIVIMYPGSQELYADWIMTDTVANLFHNVPKQYQAAADFAAEIQAEYPDEEIILTGQSLAGGSVEYAGNANDMMSFGIDPAPGKVVNPGGDKGIAIIPNGANDGLLNNIVSNESGYNQSDTHVDILNVASILGGPSLIMTSIWGQANDKPSSQESAYLNSVSESNDIDLKGRYESGSNDNMDGYFGNHFSGEIDDEFQYAYVPRGDN